MGDCANISSTVGRAAGSRSSRPDSSSMEPNSFCEASVGSGLPIARTLSQRRFSLLRCPGVCEIASLVDGVCGEPESDMAADPSK